MAVSFFTSCSTVPHVPTTRQGAIDKKGLWTGHIQNLTYNKGANLKLEINHHETGSGAASGLALITGSLIGAGKFHGNIFNSGGKFKLVPLSGTTPPISFNAKIIGNTMKGTYTIPQYGRTPKQNGVFELVKNQNRKNDSIRNEVVNVANKELKIIKLNAEREKRQSISRRKLETARASYIPSSSYGSSSDWYQEHRNRILQERANNNLRRQTRALEERNRILRNQQLDNFLQRDY